MNNIEVKVLNPEVLETSRKMTVCAARLTQRGHNIKSMNDFIDLYNKSSKDETYQMMCELPHTTIQRFAAINIVVVGASRRYLSQVSRHSVGFTFMSASLQYSDYSGKADFVIPYDIMEKHQEKDYLKSCRKSMTDYRNAVTNGIDNDAAGYMTPQGLRNVLIISANPLAFKQMISTRICNRNTLETQYVTLRIWEELYKLDPILFSISTTGAPCQKRGCQEGKMACNCPFAKTDNPTELLRKKFPLLYKEVKNEN